MCHSGRDCLRYPALLLCAISCLACAGDSENGPAGPGEPDSGPPAAPASLNALAITSSWVSLTWRDQSSDESGFQVYRGKSAEEFDTPLVTRPANAEGYDDTGLAPATKYYYRIYSYNDRGQSTTFSEDVVETPPAPGPPAIQLSVQDLLFHGAPGAPPPRTKAVLVTNAGESGTTNLVAAVSYASGSGWLEAALGGPVAPTKLYVSVSPDSVNIGYHSATITLSSPSLTNDPQTVSVALAVPCEALVLNDLGSWSEGRAVNDAGHVVGEAYDEDRHFVFMWIDGQVTEVGSLGGERTEVLDVNNAGQAIGWSETASGYNHAFLWQNGDMYDLGPWEAYYSYAHAINELGQIVGVHGSEPVLWEDGRMTQVPTPRAYANGEANSINDLGQIVGSFRSASGERHAFLSHNGEAIDLGTLGGCCSVALDINNLGQIVGWSESLSPDGLRRPFLWQDGQMTQLLGVDGWYGEAKSINDAGQIVGLGQTADEEVYAVLWEDGTPTLLGPTDSRAYDINEVGQIAGDTRVTGTSKALLWCSGP